MAAPFSSGMLLPDEQDDDDISITSTDQEGGATGDEDRDWVVDDILAERPDPTQQGNVQYLIKWEGFPIADCTWEPIENLGPGLYPQWEETKKEIEAGTREPFDLNIYGAACLAKTERHMRRNAKRMRLGLPLTEPLPAESIVDTLSPSVAHTDETESDDEAEETDEVDPARLPSTTQPPQKAIKQKTFQGIPSAKSRTDSSTPARPENPRRTSSTLPAKPSSRPPPSEASAPKPAAPASRPVGGTMTGYQGTARKPSTSTDQNASRAASGKTPNQKPSNAAPRPAPPARSSSLANKFAGKRLTATRTRPQPAAQMAAQVAASTNVFSGGKRRKKRANLEDVMADPSKAPKSFSNMRTMNLARKRAIEKGDSAPKNLSSIPTSFILTNDGTNTKPKETNQPPRAPANQPKPNQTKAKSSSTPSDPPSISHSPAAPSPDDASTVAPAPKARKSVRFTAAEDDELQEPRDHSLDQLFDEPSGIDYSTAQTARAKSPPISRLRSPPIAPRKVSLASYQERGATQVVAKTAIFGTSTSAEVRVMFYGIVRHSEPWLSAFVAQEKLHFSTVCTAKDFFSQIHSLVGERVSAGSLDVAPENKTPALNNVAESMRRISSGLHMVTPDYSILVYPSRCDGWNGLSSDVGNPKLDAPLRHLIYKSPIDPRLHIPLGDPSVGLNDPAQGLFCRVLVKRLTGLEFDKLLPQVATLKDNQVYMLLLPPFETQLSMMIKLWLRSCQPECRIFSNEHKESWQAFHEVVKAGAAGTVILHSDMTISIRKIPNIWKMLDNNHKRCYTFWDLATGEYDPPRFPSYYPSTIEPGTLQMTRLFPFGRAFLITPSFALSEPAKLVMFLEWFKTYCHNPHHILITCAHFSRYLGELVLEKAKEHDTIRSVHKDDPELERRLDELGRSRDDLEATCRAREIYQEIVRKYGDEETTFEIRKVDWVSELIDPNDEQSLVNYFCWWSTKYLDRFRHFQVLGSSSSVNKRSYRHIQVPIYLDTSHGDCDIAAYRNDLEQARDEAAEEAAEYRKQAEIRAGRKTMPDEDSEDTDGPKPDPPRVKEGSSVSKARFHFPSKLFRSDRPLDLKEWLGSFMRTRRASWSRLHLTPVSWIDVPMADQFGDPMCTYDTFKNWFYHPSPFSRAVNTWYGLFYTIDDDWNPGAPRQFYGRHPWIAVFRPVNAHLSWKGYSAMELLIWDLSAQGRSSDPEHSGHLLDMQRRLVRFVHDEAPHKFPGYYLEEVWVSSATNMQVTPGHDPLDMTCQRITEMMDDGRYWLPPFALALSNVGWKNLGREEWGLDINEVRLRELDQQAIPFPKHLDSIDKGKLERSIFAPARGQLKGNRSRCMNLLWEAAYNARMKNPMCQTTRYQYVPTMEWYRVQQEERRDYSYVHVDEAGEVMLTLPPMK